MQRSLRQSFFICCILSLFINSHLAYSINDDTIGTINVHYETAQVVNIEREKLQSKIRKISILNESGKTITVLDQEIKNQEFQTIERNCNTLDELFQETLGDTNNCGTIYARRTNDLRKRSVASDINYIFVVIKADKKCEISQIPWQDQNTQSFYTHPFFIFAAVSLPLLYMLIFHPDYESFENFNRR